jgi:hypothetical protein
MSLGRYLIAHCVIIASKKDEKINLNSVSLAFLLFILGGFKACITDVACLGYDDPLDTGHAGAELNIAGQGCA